MNFGDISSFFGNVITPEYAAIGIKVSLLLLIGIPAVNLLVRIANKLMKNYGTPHVRMLVSKALFYAGVAVIAISALDTLGFPISALLGAAGVAGVAIGFASQTSISNIISGLFLLSEQSFAIGDLIEAGSATGFVVSIDLLSVKLRTFNRSMVRVPNEYLVKNSVTNMTYFPVRRFDFNIKVAHSEDLRHVAEIINKVIEASSYTVKDPQPLIRFSEFKDSFLNLFVGVYTKRENYGKLKDTLLIEIKETFEKEGIKLPFAHMIVTMEKAQ